MMKKLRILSPKLFYIGILIATIIAVLDLYTKDVIFTILDGRLGNYIRVTSFFNLVQVYNKGVSFGMFNDLSYGIIILSLLSFSITIILFIWLARVNQKHLGIALGLVIGGAYGNLIDRIINGAVADFLDFHIMQYHWPAFNLADSAITVGAMILIFDELFLQKKKS